MWGDKYEMEFVWFQQVHFSLEPRRVDKSVTPYGVICHLAEHVKTSRYTKSFRRFQLACSSINYAQKDTLQGMWSERASDSTIYDNLVLTS